MSDVPQVFIEQNVGLTVDYSILRGEVDVIFIDWSEATPEHVDDPNDHLPAIERAMVDSARLPRDLAMGVLNNLKEWLENEILEFPANEGWAQAREIEGEIIQRLAGIRDQVDYVSHTSAEE